jgi:hypothetical protein
MDRKVKELTMQLAIITATIEKTVEKTDTVIS